MNAIARLIIEMGRAIQALLPNHNIELDEAIAAAIAQIDEDEQHQEPPTPVDLNNDPAGEKVDDPDAS